MNANASKYARRATLACLAALLLPAPGGAKARIHVSSDEIRHDDMRVPKGQVQNGDIVTSGSVVVEGTLDGDCVSLGEAVTVSGEVRGNVATFGGPASVSGTVTGDVATLGGPVTVSGSVRGDVASLGGDVVLAPGAKVSGDVALLGGHLSRADGSEVSGKVTQLGFGSLARLLPLASRFHRAAELPRRISPYYRLLGYASFLVFLGGIGLLAVLLAALFPSQVGGVADAVQGDFWKSAGIGALVVMLTGPALVLMAVSILGIPIIPLAVLLLCVGLLLALAAFSLLAARRLCASLDRPLPATAAAVGVGYLALVSLLAVGKLIKLVGGLGGLLGGMFVLAGLMLLSCGLLVGLGAAWSTRLGTRRHP